MVSLKNKALVDAAITKHIFLQLRASPAFPSLNDFVPDVNKI